MNYVHNYDACVYRASTNIRNMGLRLRSRYHGGTSTNSRNVCLYALRKPAWNERANEASKGTSYQLRVKSSFANHRNQGYTFNCHFDFRELFRFDFLPGPARSKSRCFVTLVKLFSYKLIATRVGRAIARISIGFPFIYPMCFLSFTVAIVS